MVYLEIFFVFALTVLNGVLAMSELAVVSSRRSRLEQMALDGNRGARAALRLADDPGRFLSTVQIGITLVGILAGAYGGATLAEYLGEWLDQFPFIAPEGDAVAIAIVVISITYLSLIVGELVPKRIAMNNPEPIAALVARPMDMLSRGAAPVVWLLRRSTEILLKVLRLHESKSEPVSDAEINSLVAEGTKAGTVEPQEKDLIESVLRLGDRSARSVMTPRTDVYWLDLHDSQEEIVDKLNAAHHSQLLVCDSTVDRAIGTIKTKDILSTVLANKTIDVRDTMNELVAVRDTLPLLDLMELFRRERVHMVVLVDDHGVTQGIVTTTDLLEAIAGNLPEHGDDPGPSVVQRDDGSWLVDGSLPLDEFGSRIGLRNLAEESDFETLAGFMLQQFTHVPTAGEKFEFKDHRFEVVDMDGRRIDKVLVTRMRSADDDG